MHTYKHNTTTQNINLMIYFGASFLSLFLQQLVFSLTPVTYNLAYLQMSPWKARTKVGQKLDACMLYVSAACWSEVCSTVMRPAAENQSIHQSKLSSSFWNGETVAEKTFNIHSPPPPPPQHTHTHKCCIHIQILTLPKNEVKTPSPPTHKHVVHTHTHTKYPYHMSSKTVKATPPPPIQILPPAPPCLLCTHVCVCVCVCVCARTRARMYVCGGWGIQYYDYIIICEVLIYI